jgi:hypothetical protein
VGTWSLGPYLHVVLLGLKLDVVPWSHIHWWAIASSATDLLLYFGPNGYFGYEHYPIRPKLKSAI